MVLYFSWQINSLLSNQDKTRQERNEGKEKEGKGEEGEGEGKKEGTPRTK